MSKCPDHGKLEEKVDKLEDTTKELKEGQTAILEKLEEVILEIKDKRFDDYKNCANHRDEIISITDSKIEKATTPTKLQVEVNTGRITKIFAFFSAIGILLGYIKLVH